MDPKKLGDKLKAAREARGLTQSQVADAIELSRTAIVRLEGGERSISSLELTRLARLYRRSIAELLSEEALDQDVSISLRAHPELAAADQRAIDDKLHICRIGMELEQLVGWRESSIPVPHYSLSQPQRAYAAVKQGLMVATQERQRLGLGDQPLADLADLLADQGIWTGNSDLPYDVSGIFVHDPSVGMAILVNEGHVWQRRRFSYAHEYAHALMDRDERVAVSSKENSREMAEKRANAFAAAFLMPESGVRALLSNWRKGHKSRQTHTYYDVARDAMQADEERARASTSAITYQDAAVVASHYRASYQAATYRLKSIYRLSDDECSKLLSREDFAEELLSLFGMESKPDDPVAGASDHPRELEGRVVRFIIEAYRRELISRGKLMELARDVGASGRDLLRVVEALN